MPSDLEYQIVDEEIHIDYFKIKLDIASSEIDNVGLVDAYIAYLRLVDIWDAMAKRLASVFGAANDSLEALADAVYDAQEALDKRAAERKRWGHPPKVLYANYSQPMRKIRPSARSCIRQRSNRRRE